MRNENYIGIFSKFVESELKTENQTERGKLLLRNLASCGIDHSIGMEKFYEIKRWLNSLKREKSEFTKELNWWKKSTKAQQRV